MAALKLLGTAVTSRRLQSSWRVMKTRVLEKSAWRRRQRQWQAPGRLATVVQVLLVLLAAVLKGGASWRTTTCDHAL